MEKITSTKFMEILSKSQMKGITGGQSHVNFCCKAGTSKWCVQSPKGAAMIQNAPNTLLPSGTTVSMGDWVPGDYCYREWACDTAEMATCDR